MSRKAIVTGASRGIGRGIAAALAAEGYDLAISYATQAEEAAAVAAHLQDTYGVRVFCSQASLDRRGEARKLFDRAVEDLGGLDLLVNNAGVTYFEPLGELTEQTLDLLMELDFRTYLLMMNYAARYMIDRGIHGNIVNITSSRGERAYPGDGIYGGLKAGLNRAIESFALDVGDFGIRVNNVAPGAIRIRSEAELAALGRPDLGEFWDEVGTRIPLGRSGLPEDVGNMVAFLASDRASYVTGMTIRVDGGLILPGMPEYLVDGLRPGDWRSVKIKRTGGTQDKP